jgi:hypothetical protein
MMEFPTLSGAIETIKTVAKGVKELADLQENIQTRQQAMELFNSIISVQHDVILLQSALASVQSTLDTLAAENKQLIAWGEEKKRYELCELSSGIFVYRNAQAHQRPGEPVHYLCANCYKDNVKSILQSNGYIGVERVFCCHACSSSVKFRHPDDHDKFSVMTTGQRRDFSAF